MCNWWICERKAKFAKWFIYNISTIFIIYLGDMDTRFVHKCLIYFPLFVMVVDMFGISNLRNVEVLIINKFLIFICLQISCLLGDLKVSSCWKILF